MIREPVGLILSKGATSEELNKMMADDDGQFDAWITRVSREGIRETYEVPGGMEIEYIPTAGRELFAVPRSIPYPRQGVRQLRVLLGLEDEQPK